MEIEKGGKEMDKEIETEIEIEMEEEKLKEGETKTGGEGMKKDEKKKAGRPKKVEKLGRIRRGSAECLDEFLKRKRDEVGEKEMEREEWALRRSKNIERLQEMVTEGRGEGKGIGLMIKEMGEKIMERLSEEIGKLRMEMWQREKWKEEKREMRKRFQELEKRKAEMEDRWKKREKSEEGDGKGKGYNGTEESTVEKIKVIERKMEMIEREEKRNNVVIKRLEKEEGELKDRVKKNI